jgi:hypothetical protein
MESKPESAIPKAMDRGMRDCLLGKPNSQNPYPLGSREAQLWVEGWIETDNFHKFLIENWEPGGSC